MADGPSFLENPASTPHRDRRTRIASPEELPIFSREATRALETRVDQLVGRPGNGQFRTADSQVIVIDTDSSVSLKGIRQPGKILPRELGTVVEIRDERKTHHPTDPTRQVVPYENVTVFTSRVSFQPRSTVFVQRGYYDDTGQRVPTQDDSGFGAFESIEDRRVRLQRITELLQGLSPESQINRFGRTVQEHAEDFQVAESVRHRIDELLQFARDTGMITQEDDGYRGAHFTETNPRVPNIHVARAPGHPDQIFIFDYNGGIHEGDIAEYPNLTYLIPEASSKDQRIQVKAGLQLLRRNSTNGNVTLMSSTEIDEQPRYSPATVDDVRLLLQRLSPLDQQRLWKRKDI